MINIRIINWIDFDWVCYKLILLNWYRMRKPKLTSEVLAYGWGDVPDAGGQLSFTSLVWRIPGAVSRTPPLPGVVQGSSAGSVEAHFHQLTLQLSSTRLTTARKSQHTVRHTREHSTAEGGVARVHLRNVRNSASAYNKLGWTLGSKRDAECWKCDDSKAQFLTTSLKHAAWNKKTAAQVHLQHSLIRQQATVLTRVITEDSFPFVFILFTSRAVLVRKSHWGLILT